MESSAKAISSKKASFYSINGIVWKDRRMRIVQLAREAPFLVRDFGEEGHATE
jgi:hypothetical protein